MNGYYRLTSCHLRSIDHDATLHHMSVRSQWCNRKTGNWHEILYVGNEQCKESWFAKSVDLTFASDSCIGGMQLKECKFHKCGEQTIDVVNMSSPIVQIKTMLRGKDEMSPSLA